MYRCVNCGNVEQEVLEIVAPSAGLPCCVDPVYWKIEEEEQWLSTTKSLASQ